MPSSTREDGASATQFRLTNIRESHAREIAGWQYGGEYALYNTSADQAEDAVRGFLNPDYAYHVIWNDDLGLSGFCCYGIDAQVPGGDYSEDAVDVGLGMRPDLVGQGLGQSLLQAVLQHASAGDEDTFFRATIVAFNGRSRRLFEKAGFVQEQAFTVQRPQLDSGTLEFLVVVRGPALRSVQSDSQDQWADDG